MQTETRTWETPWSVTCAPSVGEVMGQITEGFLKEVSRNSRSHPAAAEGMAGGARAPAT